MMPSLTCRGRVPAGCRWIASHTAQRSIREPCLVTCPRLTDDAGLHWQIGEDMHLEKLPNRYDWCRSCICRWGVDL